MDLGLVLGIGTRDIILIAIFWQVVKTREVQQSETDQENNDHDMYVALRKEIHDENKINREKKQSRNFLKKILLLFFCNFSFYIVFCNFSNICKS